MVVVAEVVPVEVEVQIVQALEMSVLEEEVPAEVGSEAVGFDGMGKIAVVQAFVSEVLLDKNISLASLRRALHHRNRPAASRPHALAVEEMWDPVMCGHGDRIKCGMYISTCLLECRLAKAVALNMQGITCRLDSRK